MKPWLTFAWQLGFCLLCLWAAVDDFAQAISGENVRWNLWTGLGILWVGVSSYRRFTDPEEDGDEDDEEEERASAP